MLLLKDVSRTVGGGALLRGVSLEFAAGRATAIVGLSGAEREAFARLVSGADRAQTGEIRLCGEHIWQVRGVKARVLRVGPNSLPASGQKIARLASREVAALAGLSAKLEDKLSSLSAAQRMKLALAQAVAARPALLIVEAPTAQLSPDAGDDLLPALSKLLAQATGVVVLLAATAGEALALDGDVVVFERGRVVQSGAAAEVAANPFNLASAVATAWPQLNTLVMTAREGRGVLADGARLQLPEEIAMPADGACTLAFHPGDITLERASPGCLRFVVRAAGDPRGGFLPVMFAGARWMCPLVAAAPHAGGLLNAFVDRSRLMLFDAAGKALT